MAWIAADGSMNATVVDGTTWTGRTARDGSLNIIEAPVGVFTGGTHPCGARYVTTVTSPVSRAAAPNGSMYVSVSPYQLGTRPITVISGGGGGNGAESSEWTQERTFTISTPVSNIDFLDLGGHNEVKVILKQVTSSATGTRIAFVSTNNGTTWLQNMGDYVEIATSGVETAVGALDFNDGSAATAAQSGNLTFYHWSSINVPRFISSENTHQGTGGLYLTYNTSPFNAIRIQDSGAGGLLAGGAEVWVK